MSEEVTTYLRTEDGYPRNLFPERPTRKRLRKVMRGVELNPGVFDRSPSSVCEGDLLKKPPKRSPLRGGGRSRQKMNVT